VLLVGGLFLIGKSAHEIYQLMEGDEADSGGAAHVANRRAPGVPDAASAGFASTLAQLLALDIRQRVHQPPFLDPFNSVRGVQTRESRPPIGCVPSPRT
jgi:hypothetical protein